MAGIQPSGRPKPSWDAGTATKPSRRSASCRKPWNILGLWFWWKEHLIWKDGKIILQIIGETIFSNGLKIFEYVELYEKWLIFIWQHQMMETMDLMHFDDRQFGGNQGCNDFLWYVHGWKPWILIECSFDYDRLGSFSLPRFDLNQFETQWRV